MLAKYTSLSELENPQFTLCNPGSIYTPSAIGEKYTEGTLSNVVDIICDHEAEEITFNFNAPVELQMRVNRIIKFDEEEENRAKNLYENIKKHRLIFVDNVGFFVIEDVKESITGEGFRCKDIRAKSIETELQQKKVPFIEDGTYKFINMAVPLSGEGTPLDDEGIMPRIMRLLPLWRLGEIDPSISEKYRTFSDISESKNCLAFLIEDLQDVYECIFDFDIINRIINIKSRDNYSKPTDIFITNEVFRNDIEISEDGENVYTALSVFGDDNLTISSINPIGGNVLYNFDYYLDWMSSDLRNKVISWQDEIKRLTTDKYVDGVLVRSDFRNDIFSRAEKANAVNKNVFEIDRLTTQLKMYKRCRDNIVAEKDTSSVNKYNDAITHNGGDENDKILIEDDIQETIADIDTKIEAVQSQINELMLLTYGEDGTGGLSSELEAIKERIRNEIRRMSMSSYFTPEEMAVLDQYIFEGTYKDDHIIVTDSMDDEQKLTQIDLLYKKGEENLKKCSQPTQEFSVDVESFIFAERFKPWAEQLEVGRLINVEIKEDDIAQLFLSSMSINFDDHNFRMTFGNKYNKADPQSLFDDMLGNISKSENTLSDVQATISPIKNGKLNTMSEVLQASRDLTMRGALTSDDEEVVIDGSGYTGRKKIGADYDPHQVKIVSKNIVFTDDGWDTSKVAIGQIDTKGLTDGSGTKYGINAELLVGDIIVGKELVIKDSETQNNVFEVMNNKIASVQTDVDNKVSTVEKTAEGITARVGRIEGTSAFASDTVGKVKGTGYSFTEDGLVLDRTGEEIHNRLDYKGMVVSKNFGGEVDNILVADADGVNAINLSARKYLIIGDNSRFEDYPDENNGNKEIRTACFYIQKSSDI